MTDGPSPDFADNGARSRFELTENGLTSFASYRRSGVAAGLASRHTNQRP